MPPVRDGQLGFLPEVAELLGGHGAVAIGLMLNRTTTRSPFLSLWLGEPASTTSPMNSCPSTSPLSATLSQRMFPLPCQTRALNKLAFRAVLQKVSKHSNRRADRC